MAEMINGEMINDIVNPFGNGKISYNGKTAEIRAKELSIQSKKENLEAKLKRRPAGQTNGNLSKKDSKTLGRPSFIGESGDYLKFANISCSDADGLVFEYYPEIYITKYYSNPTAMKNYFFLNNSQVLLNFGRGGFIPSLALSCNILAEAFRHGIRKNADSSYEIVNEQLKGHICHFASVNKPSDTGWVQNTIIDYSKKKIIHYPDKNDLIRFAGVAHDINQANSRAEYSFPDFYFTNSNCQSSGETKFVWLENLLNSGHRDFVLNLTGLAQPEVLIDIGNFLGMNIAVAQYVPAPNQAGPDILPVRLSLGPAPKMLNINAGLPVSEYKMIRYASTKV